MLHPIVRPLLHPILCLGDEYENEDDDDTNNDYYYNDNVVDDDENADTDDENDEDDDDDDIDKLTWEKIPFQPGKDSLTVSPN